MGPTRDVKRIDADTPLPEEFDQRLEDAVERSMSDLHVERTSRTTLRPSQDEPMTEPDER